MDRNDDIRPLLAAAFIAAVASFLVYAPSLSNGFVGLDDPGYVYRNPRIRGFDLVWAFTTPVIGTWCPLTLLSFALDYAVWGLSPFGYHLTNTLLHAANAFMVALLAGRLARGAPRLRLFLFALSSGILFGLHPIRAESVAWVSERKDVLSAFFFLASVHLYVGYARAQKGAAAWYSLTLLFFVLSLLSKAMAVTMPVVLFILDYYPLGRLSRACLGKAVLEKVPFAAISAMVSAVSVWAQAKGSAIASLEALSVAERLHLAVRGYVFYLYKYIIPAGLAPFHPRDFSLGLGAGFAAYAAALAVLTAGAIALGRRYRAWSVAWAFYAVTLLPVIGLVSIGKHAAADRYMYIPGMGLAMLASAAFFLCRDKKALTALAAAAVAASLALGALTVRQSLFWKDSVTLWTRQVEAYPEHAIGYMNRGTAYGQAGDIQGAIADLTRAVELNPSLAVAWYNRSLAYDASGRAQEAIGDLTEAIRINPSYASALHNRGAAYARAGRYAEAAADFRAAAAAEPSDPENHLGLGVALLRSGDAEGARASLEQAQRLGSPEAYGYLAELEGGAP